MAGQRLTDKSGLDFNTSAGDLYMIVDVDDTTGSSAGTSKKLDCRYVIQTDDISVSNSDFTSMDDSGGAGTYVTLVDAFGTGYAPVILGVNVAVTHASPDDSSNKDLKIGYVVDSTQYAISQRRFMSGVGANAVYPMAPQPASDGAGSSYDNAKVVMFSSGNFNGGFSAVVYITYQVIKLS